MATIPGSLLGWIDRQFSDDNGDPLAGGFVQFYEAGSSTPKDVYHDAEMTQAWTNPVELDSAGRATVFIASGGYDLLVYDADMVEQYSIEGYEDIGQTFFGSIGAILGTGARDVISGYTITDTDQFVTVASTGGPDPCVINLPAVGTRGLPISIKNLQNIPLAVTPDGTDTIDDAGTVLTVPIATGDVFPTVTLVPDGATDPPTGWLIQSTAGF
jgi:hypothetical protein